VQAWAAIVKHRLGEHRDEPLQPTQLSCDPPSAIRPVASTDVVRGQLSMALTIGPLVTIQFVLATAADILALGSRIRLCCRYGSVRP
jgi:hypothetical protein